jgi:hypothetical protein
MSLYHSLIPLSRNKILIYVSCRILVSVSNVTSMKFITSRSHTCKCLIFNFCVIEDLQNDCCSLFVLFKQTCKVTVSFNLKFNSIAQQKPRPVLCSRIISRNIKRNFIDIWLKLKLKLKKDLTKGKNVLRKRVSHEGI